MYVRSKGEQSALSTAQPHCTCMHVILHIVALHLPGRES